MKQLFALILLTVAIMLTGTYANASKITPINSINASPANFDGKKVNLKGMTKDPTRIPLINLKSYVLEDKSGEITILTDADLPDMNTNITILVRVESLAIIQGKSFGMTVVELKRYQ